MGRPAKHQVQEFDGIRFYLKPGGYMKADFRGPTAGAYMHRYVYAFHHGAIPDGHQVHHIDGCKTNNSIENLEAKSASDHISDHGHERASDPARLAQMQAVMDRVRVEASKWHGSPEGRAFHSAKSKAEWEKRTPTTLSCYHCGEAYKGFPGMTKKGFCSMSCQGMARVASGVDDVEKKCATCGNPFMANKYKPVLTCGAECRNARTAKLATGRVKSPESVAKQAAKLRGVPQSPEHIARRSEARRANNAAKKAALAHMTATPYTPSSTLTG